MRSLSGTISGNILSNRWTCLRFSKPVSGSGFIGSGTGMDRSGVGRRQDEVSGSGKSLYRRTLDKQRSFLYGKNGRYGILRNDGDVSGSGTGPISIECIMLDREVNDILKYG